MSLVKIEPQKHDVILSIAYGTHNNVTGKPLYRNPACFLRPEAERCLIKSIDLAAALGYRIKIWDAFRPQQAQQKLWDHTPNASFVAPPERGSPHTRGVAVDLTLVDAQGNDLDMGTGFDDFTENSFHSHLGISREAQINRRILLGIMTASGWDYFENEWWHYQLHGSKDFPLITAGSESDAMMG
ncbi:MAG: D-alanyl-D-alanine dipeptidase [Alphaproteobacteria bacterium]|nr:MAG: D-alanyl-D-alanine dipeptidase [Alphaproteobacteria bacterium]